MRKINLIVLALSVFLLSGCIGDSSNDNNYYRSNSGNPGRNITVEVPTPTEEPDNGSNNGTVYEFSDYDISTLSGNWQGYYSGSGTATGEGGTYSVSLATAKISIDELQAAGNTATARVRFRADWDVFQNGSYVMTVTQGDYSYELLADITKTGNNTFSLNFIDGTKAIVTITSNEAASIKQEGSTTVDFYNGYKAIYQYSTNYNITKQ